MSAEKISWYVTRITEGMQGYSPTGAYCQVCDTAVAQIHAQPGFGRELHGPATEKKYNHLEKTSNLVIFDNEKVLGVRTKANY